MLPLRDEETSGRFPFVTLLIIAANVVVFVLEIQSPDFERFIAHYALIPNKVSIFRFDTLYPFITSMFLHGGFVHIASNLWFLWIFGDNVEKRLGIFYLPFYLLTGVIASISQYFLMIHSSIPNLGASGAVAGVLGAYFVLFPHHRVRTLVPSFYTFHVVDLPAFLMLFYWFFMQILSGVTSLGTMVLGGVAWFAHIGGFVSGWFFAQFFKRSRRPRIIS